MGAAESTGRPNGTTEKEEEEQRRRRQQESGGSFTEKAATAATLAAGVAVAAWGISRILSNNTKSDEENDDTAIKSINPSIRASIRGDRFISTVTDRGYRSRKGQSSGYYEGIISEHDGGSDVAKLVWSPPPRGRFKMNTDGSCKPNPGPSGGYGGILRNHHGDFVYGFCGFIDRSTDGLTAEFTGIRKGLELLIELGYTYMGTILETDCRPAEQWINSKDKHVPGNSDIISACWDIILECRTLKAKYEIDIIHIGEDANKCADKLAAMGAKKKKRKKGYMEFKAVPYEIKNFVDDDKRLMGC
ncbi:hypothetical protein LXL04_006146 [Taraxacum kok-saghyz]